MRAAVMALALIALYTASWGCGAKEPVPQGATPEDVVRILFQVAEKRDVKTMLRLFDPDSASRKQVQAVMFPPVSMSNVVLETRSLTDHQAEVVAEFDVVFQVPSETGTEQRTGLQTHSKTRFTLIKKSDGRWRLTGIHPAD